MIRQRIHAGLKRAVANGKTLVGRSTILRRWKSLDWRFAELESWMQRNYVPMEGPPVNVGGYRLWRRAQSGEAAALRQ